MSYFTLNGHVIKAGMFVGDPDAPSPSVGTSDLFTKALGDTLANLCLLQSHADQIHFIDVNDAYSSLEGDRSFVVSYVSDLNNMILHIQSGQAALAEIHYAMHALYGFSYLLRHIKNYLSSCPLRIVLADYVPAYLYMLGIASESIAHLSDAHALSFNGEIRTEHTPCDSSSF